jgi:hypothetical protein
MKTKIFAAMLLTVMLQLSAWGQSFNQLQMPDQGQCIRASKMAGKAHENGRFGASKMAALAHLMWPAVNY